LQADQFCGVSLLRAIKRKHRSALPLQRVHVPKISIWIIPYIAVGDRNYPIQLADAVWAAYFIKRLLSQGPQLTNPVGGWIAAVPDGKFMDKLFMQCT